MDVERRLAVILVCSALCGWGGGGGAEAHCWVLRHHARVCVVAFGLSWLSRVWGLWWLPVVV